MRWNHKRTAVIVVVFALAFSAGIYFRLYPFSRNPRRHAEEISRIVVLSNLRQIVGTEIERSSPHLPPAEKEKLIRDRVQVLTVTEKDNFEEAVNNLAEELKHQHSFYLLGADPYYYYRLTHNLITRGKIGEKIERGRFFDPLMTAPLGHWRNVEALPYIGFLVHRFLNFFIRHISLTISLAIVPLLLFPACLLLFFFVCSEMRIPTKIVLPGSFFFALSPIFIQRSCMGWYDTDPFNVMFPLAAIAFLGRYFKNGKTTDMIALAFVTGSFSFFWQGWTILASLVIVCFIVGTFIRIPGGKAAVITFKDTLIFVVIFSATAALFITPSGLAASLQESLDILKRFSLADMSIWPDIYITVGELRRADPKKIFYLTGGPLFAVFAVYGALSLMIKRSVVSKEFRASILLFTAVSFLLALSGERFSIFLVGPGSLCLVYGLKTLYSQARRPLLVITGKKRNVTGFILTFFLVLSIASPLTFAHAISQRLRPKFNAVWETVLRDINSLTPDGSIINTWWPPGHFIRAIAERGVTFDGATFEVPQGYWIARALMSDDEKKSLGILRMLNSSGNKAVEFLEDKGIVTDKAVNIIKNILTLDKHAAKNKLSGSLDADSAGRLVALTHGTPPPSFCFVYNDLLENILGLYYVARWDLSKASSIRDGDVSTHLAPASFSRGTSENIELLWKISGGRHYIGSESFKLREKDGVIFFRNGVSIDTNSMEARIDSLEGQITGIPRSILFPARNELMEKPMPGANLNLSILFIRRPGGRSSCIVAPADVLRSIAFRLYYLNGTGLTSFTPFLSEEDPSLNTRILVYKINW